MKTRAIACGLAIAASMAWGFWAPTPISQLAADSDCVVIGRVQTLAPDHSTHRVQVTMNELQVVKGYPGLGSSVTFDAPFTLFHCVIFLGPDGKRLPPALDSFTTNETCAVFLRFPRETPTKLRLVSDEDGKFSMDWSTLHLHRLKAVGTSLKYAHSLHAFYQEVEKATKQQPTIAAVYPTLPSTVTNVPPR